MSEEVNESIFWKGFGEIKIVNNYVSIGNDSRHGSV